MALEEPPQRGERRLIVRWRSKVPRLSIAYHAPAIAHPDTYPLQVLAVVLAEGKARAHRWSPETGYVTSMVDDEQDLESAMDLIRMSHQYFAGKANGRRMGATPKQ